MGVGGRPPAPVAISRAARSTTDRRRRPRARHGPVPRPAAAGAARPRAPRDARHRRRPRCRHASPAARSATTARRRPAPRPDRPRPPAGRAGGPAAMGAESDVEVADGEIPEETAGPYPGDGSNGPNVLTESGVVRSDITSQLRLGVGGGRGRAADPAAPGLRPGRRRRRRRWPAPRSTLWHCDREGSYSMYDGDVVDENYLRGVQEADEDGWLEFTTIFPACYAGRWPHVHFEVYESLDSATSAVEQAAHLPARVPPGRLRRGLRDRRATSSRVDQPGPASAWTPTASSATATRCRWPRSPARSTTGYVATLNVPV